MAGREKMARLGDDLSASPDEVHEIEALVRKAALPEGFPNFHLTFGEDSTGDPAVWISFLVEHSDKPTREQRQAVRELRRKVLRALFQHQIRWIPYIRFREAPVGAG